MSEMNKAVQTKANQTVEVLITTMNCQDPIKLLKQMNIQGTAMIGNQITDGGAVRDCVSETTYQDYCIPMYSFREKGVGLNRNNLLMRTASSYCLFGDDDLTFTDGYEQAVIQYFEQYPDADVLIFNLLEQTPTRYLIKDAFKVNAFNYMRFGAARIAVRSACIQTHGILFNTCFGGGAHYSNGEDTLFLSSCLKAGLKIYAIPYTIAQLREDRKSTWFEGYKETYFLDKGLLYYLISRRWYHLLILQDAYRHRKMYGQPFSYLWNTMNRGVKDAKNRRFTFR